MSTLEAIELHHASKHVERVTTADCDEARHGTANELKRNVVQRPALYVVRNEEVMTHSIHLEIKCRLPKSNEWCYTCHRD